MGRLFQYSRFKDEEKDILWNQIEQKGTPNKNVNQQTQNRLKKSNNNNKHNSIHSEYSKLLKIAGYDSNNITGKDINTDGVKISPIKCYHPEWRKDIKNSNNKILTKGSSPSSTSSSCGTKANSNSKLYGYMKDFLRRKFLSSQRRLSKGLHDDEDIYVELPNCIKMINNNLGGYEKNSNDNHINRFDGMQDIRLRVDDNSIIRNGSSSPTPSAKRRPIQLFASNTNLNCNDNEKIVHTPSSDEDNSPTEMNNCKRLVDKPPLVKRLAGLLRSSEEHRPLVNQTVSSLKSGSTHNLSNGYVNEAIFEPEKFISSKFGDSCRQSLTSIPMLDTLNLNDNAEFNLKKKYLRETSSANSSPKIFANRLRTNSCSATSDESDLKDAPWFQAGISRAIALEILSRESAGAFLVRKSSSKPGCYALSLRLPSPPGPKVAHYIILRSARGFKIKGFRKEFSTLKALITHHSVMPELLPVPLSLPRPSNVSGSRRNLDDFDTYDSLKLLGILKFLQTKNLDNE